MNLVEVNLFLVFFICGSGKVIQISDTSPGMKNDVISSMFVRMNATFASPCTEAWFAPVHIRAPLMSMPMKFLSGKRCASPTVYSPFPHPSSSPG